MVSGQWKVLLCAVRLKSCWHKEKETSPVEKWLVQCLGLSHLSVFPLVLHTGIGGDPENIRHLPLAQLPVRYGVSLLIGRVCGGFFFSEEALGFSVAQPDGTQLLFPKKPLSK